MNSLRVSELVDRLVGVPGGRFRGGSMDKDQAKNLWVYQMAGSWVEQEQVMYQY